MSVGHSHPMNYTPSLPQPSLAPLRQKPVMNKGDYFCYRCGEDGNIASKCQAPENSTQVINKLVRSLRKAKEMRNDPNYNNCSGDRTCFSKNSHIHTYEPNGLPKGLVGPTSMVKVKICGQSCESLLDSGSQVTLVFDSCVWYSQNLPDVPIHPLTGLSIWGLGSSSYPYKRYIIVDVLISCVSHWCRRVRIHPCFSLPRPQRSSTVSSNNRHKCQFLPETNSIYQAHKCDKYCPNSTNSHSSSLPCTPDL